jgi:glycosyltransferase involved in cell wall biosynthesis
LNHADIGLVCHPYTARKDVGAGHDRYVYELLKELKKTNYTYQVLDSGEINSLSSAMWKEVIFPFRLLKSKPKIFHATASVPARSPIWTHKRPLITTIHDVIWFFESQQDMKLKSKYKQYCIRLAAEKSDCIIVPAESTKNFIMERFQVPEHRIRLVPYGLDHAQFYVGEKQERNIRKILFVGATNRGKGVDSLIKCFSKVTDQFSDVELHIASKGWDTDYLKNLHQNSRAKEKIMFIGFIPEGELRKAYIDADIFVFPSRYGFGLSTFEAMACGTPTISGNRLDAPDYIENSGLLVDPDNLEELADAMIRLLKDKALYKSLQAKGLAHIKKFSWQKMGQQIIEAYKEFL